MRVFIGLDIDDEIRSRISRFMDAVREFAPDARWVRPESMHITLKFIGEKPTEAVEQIKTALANVHGTAMDITFQGYGFFPTPKSARVFWVGIQASEELPSLATAIDHASSRLGIPNEEHPFSPHLTLARRGGRSGTPKRQKQDSPNSDFGRLQAKLAVWPQPEFGTMTAREFYLYESKLGPGGSKYTKLAKFPLQ